jgi:hypothetical protein
MRRSFTTYSSQNSITVLKSRMVGLECLGAHMGEMRNGYKILVRKAEGKRELGRQRHRWEDIIKTDLTEVGHKRHGSGSNGSGYSPVVSSWEYCSELPSSTKSENSSTNSVTVSFSVPYYPWLRRAMRDE